ncbi:Protein MAIN-LIKE 1 [Glycine soja]
MRGRQDEHDAVDVPQRRRPTASARRQRVHITVDEGAPQDVPQVSEDVPHMANDVAQMSEDVPQMTADVDATVAEDLGRDGAEGSHADEGFPSGPRDPSVLTSFVEYVAHAIWTGQCPELKLVSHERKVALIGRPVPAIEGLVVATGLSPLIECSVVTSDPGLISAFMERWHRETSTFHLPVGELTITLDDVSSLLHLPISGAFHGFEALSVDEALLEVSDEEARVETIRACEAYGPLSWVREIYEMRCQCWIYEYFPSVHQCVTDDAYEEMSPRTSRWLMMKAHMKGITGALYRACCDALTVTDVCWFPYSDHRGVRGFELISSFQGQLRWGPTVVTVRPERVIRQFGYIQSIPPPPISASLSYDDIDDSAWAGICGLYGVISHPFMIPTQAGDQPRHAPASDHEDYMQPDIPQVPVAFDPPRHAVMITKAMRRSQKKVGACAQP